MKPLLAHVYEPHRVTYPCFVQPKLNGIRALFQGGRFQSRDEQPFAPALLEHLAKPLREAFGPEVILDGELYKHGWPLQRINGAVTPVRKEENEDTKEVEYHIFDVVDYGLSFADRVSTTCCATVFPQINWVRIARVDNENEANQAYAQFVADGYEGMMFRLGDCPYTTPKQKNTGSWNVPNAKLKFLSDQDNRTFHLLKRKSWQDDEFEIVGIVEGEGKYKGMLGAITCADAEPRDGNTYPTFNVGSGLSDADRLKYFEYPMLAIGHKAKVKFLCLSEDGIPLNPTLLAII